MVLICPYSEINKETIRNVESEHCTFSALLKKKESSTRRDFIRKVQTLHYPTGKKDQCRGITVALKYILVILYFINCFIFIRMLF